MPTDCDVNQKSEPIWVLLKQSAMARYWIFLFSIIGTRGRNIVPLIYCLSKERKYWDDIITVVKGTHNKVI